MSAGPDLASAESSAATPVSDQGRNIRLMRLSGVGAGLEAADLRVAYDLQNMKGETMVNNK